VKILLVDPSLYTPPYDGALAGALMDRGHDVRIVGRALRPTDPSFGDDRVPLDPLFYRRGERLRARRGDGLAVRLAKAAEHVFDLQRLRARVRDWRPDVVHWQWPSLPLLDAGALRRLGAEVPQVATVHDARVFKSKQGARRAMSVGWARFLGAADALVVHVPATRDAVVAMGVPGERVSIVPHGIFARPGGPAPVRARTDGRLQVAFFGRLSADKGIDVLAAAIERLPDAVAARLQVHVCGPVIGDDPRVTTAVAALQRAACVRLVPRFISEAELDALLAGADVAVLPHREVDASGALMKALGYDVAVLAADVRAFREVLGASASTRWFRCEDPADLAEQLASLASAPETVARMRTEVAALRRSTLSWGHAAVLTEAVYRGVQRVRATAGREART
jgi:glycosyltransferase involved in cell wall biosynthesis